jgi:hypothetical protein
MSARKCPGCDDDLYGDELLCDQCEEQAALETDISMGTGQKSDTD